MIYYGLWAGSDYGFTWLFSGAYSWETGWKGGLASYSASLHSASNQPVVKPKFSTWQLGPQGKLFQEDKR